MSHLNLVKFYHRYNDDSGRIWFVPYDTKFPADDVWSWHPERRPSKDSTVRVFTLSPGSSMHCRDAHLSSAENLYAATGIDVRNRHAIKMKVVRVIGGDLLYQDHDWVVSSVDISRDNAQHIANHNGVQVTASIETVDG